MKSKYKEVVEAIEKHRFSHSKEYYSIRSLMGNSNWATIYIILATRGYGKTVSVVDMYLKDWKRNGIPFTWLRINEASTKKLLANNAHDLIDPVLRAKYDLELTVKGTMVYDGDKMMCRVLALSTFANDKGVAIFDPNIKKQNVLFDEFELEKGQKRQGDIVYQLIGQTENLRLTHKDRLILLGNTLEEASDILALFNFIPEEFGRYKIKAKKCVIDYLPPSKEYLEKKSKSIGMLLSPESSAYTNKIDRDRTLLTKKRLIKPTAVIHFDKKNKFTIWDNNVVKEYNGEKCNINVAMRPYIDLPFDIELRDNIVYLYDCQSLMFSSLISKSKFSHQLTLIKPRGSK